MSARNRPIFLVGCPRSGTTLLSVMLHAHPRIAMPPETRFLLPTYYNRASFGDLTVEENRRRLARAMTQKGTRFADLGLRRKDVVAKIVAGAPTVGSAAGTIWREFARSRGKARWGEKRPAYYRDMGAIFRMFPDAQVIHLVRDGRSCVASLKELTWWKDGALGGMAVWTIADRELRPLADRLPADSYHRLRYEDLLAEPRAELESLCRFLGEEFDDAMLNHVGAAGDIVPRRKSWHDRTHGAVDPARIAAWRTVLEPEEVGLFELVAGRLLAVNGYEPHSDVARRPSPRAVAAYYRVRSHKLAVMYKERATDAVTRRRYDQPVADQE